jgi:hypothetical protein
LFGNRSIFDEHQKGGENVTQAGDSDLKGTEEEEEKQQSRELSQTKSRKSEEQTSLRTLETTAVNNGTSWI